LLNKLRRDLSGYNHSQPDATNGAIWQSNGPIWVPEAFHQTYCYFRDVMAMALVLLAIGWARFAIPEVWRPLFESPAGLWKDIPSAVPRRWF
jgi:hypothetical protein